MHTPLWREKENADTLVLFVHGFMGSPNQFGDLAETVYDAGCSVAALLLPGHGEARHNLPRCGAGDWQAHLQNALVNYAATYQNIYLLGHSIGGLLALNASLNPKNQVRGVFVLSSPLLINYDPRALLYRLKLLGYPRDNQIKAAYWQAKSVPLIWALGPKPLWACHMLMRETHHNLPRVTVPVVLVHSKRDETVSLKSAEIFCAGLSNTTVKRILLEQSWHAYFPAPERELVRAALLDLVTGLRKEPLKAGLYQNFTEEFNEI